MEKQKQDWNETANRLGKFVWTMSEEIFHSIHTNSAPALFTFSGMACGGFASLYISESIPIGIRMILTSILVFSGWILWGARKAYERLRLLEKLQEAFTAAKLSCNGRYPALIEDVSVDDRVRKLRLHCNGVTEKEFTAVTDKLEAVLNFSVVRVMQEKDDRSKIEIVYTVKDLPKEAYLDRYDAFAPGEIPIGFSYDGPVRMSLRNIGHMLVAGQTGGGKSNFLKLVSYVLMQNNPDARICFLDFKGGMESGDLKASIGNLGDNVEFLDGTKACAGLLTGIGAILEARFQEFAKLGAATYEDYQKKRLSMRNPNEAVRVTDDERMTFIVIDEIAQLYVKNRSEDKKMLDDAKSVVNRIARQGRAAGVHLIVATQKPDSLSFDQTVKANLPAVLCFSMPNQAASVSALGTKRAFELNPEIKGRAVFKYGPKVEEVQTYYFN